MKIRLNEIPPEGRHYEFDRRSGEMNEKLGDLVHEHPYDVKMFIKPVGNAYELRGEVRTQLNETCSTCGYDFEMPIDRSFHEFLMEENEEYRKSHSVHGNHSLDFSAEGPSVAFYRGDVFDAGEYVHEAVALAEPFYPTCGKNGQCEHIDEVSEIRRRLEEDFAVAEEKSAGHPAFSVLKGLDLKSKQ